MLDRLTALMTGRHGAKIFVASLVLVLGSTTGVVVRAATGGGGGGGPDNAAVAVNTNDESSEIKVSFQVSRTNAEAVDPANAAVAYSSCTDCQTVAIAIQAVIAWGDPSIVSPINLALAVNENCTLCLSYADARQHVITSDVPNFSAEGNQRIAALRRDLQELRQEWKKGTLTTEQLDARIDALSAELGNILSDEFTAASAAAADASPSPSPSTSPDGTSPSPTASSDVTTTSPEQSSPVASPDPSPGLSP